MYFHVILFQCFSHNTLLCIILCNLIMIAMVAIIWQQSRLAIAIPLHWESGYIIIMQPNYDCYGAIIITMVQQHVWRIKFAAIEVQAWSHWSLHLFWLQLIFFIFLFCASGWYLLQIKEDAWLTKAIREHRLDNIDLFNDVQYSHLVTAGCMSVQ